MSDALEHILSTVFGLDDKSPLTKALKAEGVTYISEFLTLDPSTIDSLTYVVEEKGKRSTVPVPKGHRRLITVFFDFVLYRKHQGTPVGEDWISITAEEFDAFRISPEYLLASRLGNGGVAVFQAPTASQSMSLTPGTTTSSSNTSRTISDEDMFKRGIKRDQTLFPTLKDEKFHDSWHRTFENQAHAQDVAEILDHTYVPSSPSQQQLLKLKQTFMYAVLEAKVLTSKGKEIVRKYEDTKDAQAAYQELVQHHRSSTSSSIAACNIMGYLTSVTLGDGQFRGTTVEFLAHWTQQVRLYQKLMGSTSTFGDAEKLVHLVRAVATVPELRQIKNTADMLAVSTGNPLTFDKYYELLSSAASQYDDGLRNKPKRMVYSHDVEFDD